MAAMVALGAGLILLPFVPLSGGSASADTAPYELYCPGTPVGRLVMNDVQTTGTMVPASPSEGQRFSITDYQTTIPLPIDIVAAAAALGNSVISGTVTSSIHVLGARPTKTKVSNQPYSVPIPSPVPTSSLTIAAPARAVGPFTAKRSGITISVESPTRITLVVAGSNLNLRCRSYRDNALPTGITRGAPSSYPTTPVIARSTS